MLKKRKSAQACGVFWLTLATSQDTLIKLVEDLKDNLVVVLAGYTAEMEELLSHNPGVRWVYNF